MPDIAQPPTTLPGYIYVEMFITDAGAVRHYAAISGGLVEAAGGEYIALGAPKMLEGGHLPTRCALIRFATAEAAATFYHSAAYQSARERRRGAGAFRIVLMSGRPASTEMSITPTSL